MRTSQMASLAVALLPLWVLLAAIAWKRVNKWLDAPVIVPTRSGGRHEAGSQ